MNGRSALMALAAIGALALVGYAVFVLLQREVPGGSVTSPSPSADAPADPVRARPEPSPFLPVDRHQPAQDNDPPRSRPVLPPAQPKPAPKVTLEEAREALSDLLAELDREVERSAEGARPLSNDAWTDYYRRGNETIAAIARARQGEAGAAEEISRAHEEVRTRLDVLQTQ